MPKTLVSLACLALLASILATSAAPASAGGLPPPASKLQPPRYIDESMTELFLLNRVGGYVFTLRSIFRGPSSDSDALRVDLVHKGKTIASQRCPLGSTTRKTGIPFECDYEGTPVKAVGELTANLVYIDDQAEKEYLLRQFHVTVGVFPWMKERHYQVLQDDMLGTAFLTHQTESAVYEGTGDHQIIVEYWTTAKEPETPVLRCAVDGKRLPDEKTNGVGVGGAIEVDMLVGKEKRVYSWSSSGFSPDRLLWGTFEEVKETRGWSTWDHAKAAEERYHFLADHPGAWACDVRMEGRVIRQLTFQVNDKGRVLPSASQSAEGFPLLPPGVVHVNMRIPAKGHGETRFRPQAIRKSMRYGMPWPKHPVFDAFKKSLPPPSGLPDPPTK